MPAKTVTTREFVCDNCGEGDVFDKDADAGRAGWALVDVNGEQFALCPEHHRALKALLMSNTFTLRPLNTVTLAAPPETGATVQAAMQHMQDAFHGREKEKWSTGHGYWPPR